MDAELTSQSKDNDILLRKTRHHWVLAVVGQQHTSIFKTQIEADVFPSRQHKCSVYEHKQSTSCPLR